MAGDLQYEIRFDEDGPADLTVVTSGVASVAGLRAFTAEALDDPRIRPRMRILIDHTNVDWSTMSTDDLRRRADDLSGHLIRLAGAHVAVVVGSSLGFGLQRMLQAFGDRDAQRARVAFRVFYSQADAESWLEGV